MDPLENAVSVLLGLNADSLNEWQMGMRAVVVYLVGLGLVRIGEKRWLGQSTAFDVILGIMLGSVLSRAITGSASFFPALGASLVMVLLHWLFSALAFRSDWFGNVIKGRARMLVENGEILWKPMRKSNVSRQDLLSALREEGNMMDVEKVQEARLERSGTISIIKKNSQPKVLEVRVEQGVQTVRIELSE